MALLRQLARSLLLRRAAALPQLSPSCSSHSQGRYFARRAGYGWEEKPSDSSPGHTWEPAQFRREYATSISGGDDGPGDEQEWMKRSDISPGLDFAEQLNDRQLSESLSDASVEEDEEEEEEALEHFVGGEAQRLSSEEEQDGPLDYVDPIEAQLQGVPRKMRRFLLQKMLKMKPTEAPSVGRMKRQFQMRVIDVNRTCKVTKGGGVFGFTAFVVCGNGNGAVGFGKGKSAEVAAAVDKAYSRSIRNLHYFERFEERTLYQPIVAKYEKTKVYLWPGKDGVGMRAGSTVGGILRLAGFRDVKTKVIGSRHPHNTVKATFKALSMVQPPQEVIARMESEV